MKVYQVALGTRGDMEPPLAVAKLLQQQGHRVVCVFPEQFCSLAEQAGVESLSLGSEWYEFMERNLNLFTDPSMPWWKKLLAVRSATKEGMQIHEDLAARIHKLVQTEQPDKILYSAKAIFSAVYGIEQTSRVIFHCPLPYMHYGAGHAHVGFKGKDYGTLLNKLSYWLVDKRVVSLLVKSAKLLGIEGVDKDSVQRVLEQQKVIYTLSPSLFTRPAEWTKNIKLLGYHERNKVLDWQPSEELLALLRTEQDVLFITFGSMTNKEPKKYTEMILKILVRNNITAVINTYSGGLLRPKGWDNPNIIFVDSIPYDWIFEKVTAVMHHGGAGTTHMATKYECPSLIIPHAVDQFVWDQIIYERELGPKGMAMGKLSELKLQSKIIDLMSNQTYRANAKAVATQMQNEQELADTLCREIIQD